MAKHEKLQPRSACAASAVILASCLVVLIYSSVSLPTAVAVDVHGGFTFNGFLGANLTLDGMASVTPEGLLRLSNATKMLTGHAVYPSPVITLSRRDVAGDGSIVPSFSTTFVFGIQFTQISGHGILLFFSATTDFRHATGSQYLGVFNLTNYMENPANRIVAVELDTILNPEFRDMNDNHVGIDVSGVFSRVNNSAGYYMPDGRFRNLSLNSGELMQVWVDYDAGAAQMTATLGPFKEPKPRMPLLSLPINLSSIFTNFMYVGFSSSTGPFLSSHYIAGWSFSTSGEAQLDLSALPSLPQAPKINTTRALLISLPTSIVAVLALASVAAGVYMAVRRRGKYGELIEEWEQEYAAHRFRYKVLFDATEGFSYDRLLGSGGFGSVYRGVLPTTKAHVAVKKVSHESRQGIREFVAEIVSIGRIRHRNVVQLMGYCRRRGELLLVYEFMPNGSLDKLLFCDNNIRDDGVPPPPPLDWNQRFQIIKDVASGLQYLHEEWEQVVIHRDIKASNVLLDGDLSGRLGDFGLARLYDHGTDPQTTHVMGTMGYLAPELTRTSKSTKATDVFAYGIFLLEVATGRRPIEPRSAVAEVILVDWVLDAWKRGVLLEVADPRLNGRFEPEDIETVLKLGLICSHPLPTARPEMKHVVRFLNSDGALPELSTRFLDLQASGYAELDAFTYYCTFSSSPPSATDPLLSSDGYS